MASLNKVMIIGNLGKDPEVSYTPSGMAVARFSVATTDYWNDKATGERKEKTEWHRIVAFAKLGETCGRYLTKGKSVYVEGRLQTTSYEKDGITRYTTDIIASTIQFIGPRGEGGGAPQQGGGGYPQNSGYQGGGGGYQKSGPAYPPNNRGPQNAPPQNQGGYSQGPGPDFDPYMGDPGFQPPPDDDIPF
jgi:single-strand DNA-binding protein